MATVAEPARGRRRAYRGISGGVTLMCIGVVLLLNTLGMVSWGVWHELVKLWPLLLISIGLRWIFAGAPAPLHLVALIGPILIAAATFWVVSTYSDAAYAEEWSRIGEPVAIDCPPPGGREPARIALDLAGGELRLISEQAAPRTSGSATGPATGGGIHGTLRFAGHEPRHECDAADGLRIRHRGFGAAGVHVIVPFGGWNERWEARLASAAPVDLSLKLAATDADIDVRDFDVRRVDLDAAASRVDLTLGAPRDRVTVRIKGAVDSLHLIVPEGTCYTVSRDRILSILDAGDGLRTDDRGRHLTSAACSSAGPRDPRYEIRYELPVSSVTIESEGHPI